MEPGDIDLGQITHVEHKEAPTQSYTKSIEPASSWREMSYEEGLKIYLASFDSNVTYMFDVPARKEHFAREWKENPRLRWTSAPKGYKPQSPNEANSFDTLYRMRPWQYEEWQNELNWAQLDTELDREARIREWQEEQRAKQKKSLLLTDADIELLESPSYLLDGLLVRNSIAQLFSHRGTGKTFLASDWAYHVAAGLNWMGREVAKPESTLYVVAEGKAGLKKRHRAWKQEHPGADISRAHFYPAPVNLMIWSEVKEFIEDFVLPVGPALIIFDTQAMCAVGAVEDSATDMGKVLENVRRIREASEACCLLLHHTGHQERSRGRGSSAVPAALDTELTLTAEAAIGDNVPLLLTVTKQRDDSGASLKVIRRKVWIGDTGESSCVITPTGEPMVRMASETLSSEPHKASYKMINHAKILLAMQPVDGSGVTSTDWKEAAGIKSWETHSHLRKAALLSGLVQLVREDGNTKYYAAVPEAF